MVKLFWTLLGIALGAASLYGHFRADYRADVLNVAPRVKIQTLFGRYEEDDSYRE